MNKRNKGTSRIDVIVTVISVAWVFVILFLMQTRIENRVRAEPTDTYHSGWHAIEAVGAEDAGTFAAEIALASDGGDFASMTSEAFRIPTLPGAGPYEPYSAGAAWMFAFAGTDAANETFSFDLVGWARGNGMAQVMCEGDGVLGSQDVVIYPGGLAATGAYWADTINLDELTKWPEIGTYNASGDNEVALLLVDLAGIEYIDFVIYDAAGGAEATSVGVYGRRY